MQLINLTNHFRLLLVFSFFCLGILSAGRLANMLYFGNFDELSLYAGEIAAMLFLGFRFDLKVLAILLLVFYWIPVSFLAWWVGAEKLRRFLQTAFSCLILLLLSLVVIEFGYWIFFGGPLDVMVFGFLEDDTLAIMSTIFAEWRFMALAILFFILAIFLYKLFFLFSDAGKKISEVSSLGFVLIQAILLILLVSLNRGSFGPFPLRVSNASVGSNAFINSLVLGSIFNLKKAIDERDASGINQSSEEILRLAKVNSLSELEEKSGFKPGTLIKRTSLKQAKLPHVIFVLAEGWSTEIALEHSDSNQVLGEMDKHINEDYFYRFFFSNGYGTNETVEALLLNSPITPLSQSPAQKTVFSLSNVWPFKRSGYRTLFISGGDSSWRNHEKFWPLQGFDAYLGRTAIEQRYPEAVSDNPWGVYENYLFAYVEEKISKAEADGVPLFAFVMTTNNHPPVHLPDNYLAPPIDPSVYGFESDDQEKRDVLSGYHYQTDQMGKFLSRIKTGSLKDKVIITATGDHILKAFSQYNALTRSYLRYSVPGYFYVPASWDKLVDIPNTIVGSHQDIFPTLFELALSDAEYYQFGTAIMLKNPEHAYGWVNQNAFIFNEGVADIKTRTFYEWADETRISLNPQGQELSQQALQVIEKEKFRKLLRESLILKDFNAQ